MKTNTPLNPEIKSSPQNPIECAAVICFRGPDALLIRRGTPPRQGEWSIPGGRIKPDEKTEDAALRELFEETGVRAKLGRKVAIINAEFEGQHYRLHDYHATWISGEPQAGDDAAEARFFAPDAWASLGMWEKTLEVIQSAAP